ncbi:MAG: hypothetical protein LAO23_02980 [Acidobacteriia bacterium]|nr:hypothetical protein [Terriglobia bacterium]
MALARIITRSQACSRELALDLLARGYAVEIVSPDAVPDNIADLELRVDSGPGDRLTATVAAHDGERSASLDFVHHLKAPMGDFIRRPPEPPDVVRFVEQPVRRNAEPPVKSPALPAQIPQPAQKIVSPSATASLPRKPDLNDAAPLTVPPDPVPTPPLEIPGYFAVEDSTVVPPAIVPPTITQPTVPRPVPSWRRRDGSAAWGWRAALTFGGVVLLAAVLGFGMRRTGKPAVQDSEAAPVEKVAAASPETNFPGAADSERDAGKDPRQVPALASSPSAVNSEGNSGHATKGAPVAKAAAATPSRRVRSWRKHGDDLIARNTVTYLDKRFEPGPVRKPAPKVKTAKSPVRRPSWRKRGGVIAANDVTYLHKPSPKTPK